MEVNGTLVVWCRNAEELARAVGAAAPARLVLLRARLPDSQRTFTQVRGTRFLYHISVYLFNLSIITI